MTSQRRGPLNRRSRSNAARANRRVTILRQDVKGQHLRLSPDPPSFTQIPWQPITLSDSPVLGLLVNTKNYTAADICNIFKAQTGCSQANTGLSFRLFQVSVWELSGKKVTLEVYDLTLGLGANDYLAQLEDIPGRNQWARVGYKYPTSQNLVIFSGNDAETLLQVTSENGASFAVRFHVLWRFRFGTIPNRTIAPNNLAARLDDLERQLSALTHGLDTPSACGSTDSN